ncbi:MAG: peptidoglycan DD-metalloendopeptidase family protein [bacterium]|nr:MAG: peptidoglycan DD-metalloendopeptidase family protein [bacterium]
MREKRIKLIFFSLRGSEVRDFDLSWQKILLFSTMLVIILIILVGAVVGLLTNFYQNSRITTLQKTNQILKNQLGEMRRTIDKVTADMQKIETYDDDQRLIAGLDKIDKDMRHAGRGGPSYEFANEANALTRETRDEITNIKIRVDQLERRIQLALESQNEINQVLEKKQEKLQHLPTINPVRKGRITDKFGNRIDPFVERPKQHTGIDIAAPAGTPIRATAHGVVEIVHQRYSPNRNYGKYIVINHGFGKETLYAHLSKIFVKPGQRIERWDIVGEVGETGRATGPHLHYEVRENGIPVDPLKYFFE